MFQSLPLSPEVKSISPNGVAALAKDVQYLTEFVDTLDNPILKENLDELQQTVALIQTENSDEFYDVATRNKKYGRVDAVNGPILLEKYDFPASPVRLPVQNPLTVFRLTHSIQSPVKNDKFATLSSRFAKKL